MKYSRSFLITILVCLFLFTSCKTHDESFMGTTQTVQDIPTNYEKMSAEIEKTEK